MRILFISGFYPEQQYTEIMRNTVVGMDASADVLQKKIVQGLLENGVEHVHFVNTIPMGSYPRRSKLKHISFDDFEILNSSNYVGTNTDYCNISIVKQLVLPSTIWRTVTNVVENSKPFDVVIIYAVEHYYYQTICHLSRIGLPIVWIVPDLPEFNGLEKKSIIRATFQKHYSTQFRKILTRVDGLVVLTKQTIEYLRWEKPYTVIEGIASENPVNCELSIPYPELDKFVLYTGSTHEIYGILDAVRAFQSAKLTGIKFVICGEGDADERLREVSDEDPSIVFLGMIAHAEAICLQKRAMALINPRKNIGEYTKYSFPSKTMEYLVTGHPVIAYMLDGIPKEYEKYINSPNDNSMEEMTRVFQEVLGPNYQKCCRKAQDAYTFVHDNKTPKGQIKKLLELVKKCKQIRSSVLSNG